MSEPSIHALKKNLTACVQHVDVLAAMIDELAGLRAKERLRADVVPPAGTDDLPPDGATGLYLDIPFSAEDLVWLRTALEFRGENGIKRYGQLMLVFAALQRDERAMNEFFRVMNTLVLPLLRRQRLKTNPELAKLGSAGE